MNMWPARIASCQSNVDVWQSILAVRALVTPHTVDTLTWLKFVAICRDNGCAMLSLKTLVSLGIDSTQAQQLSVAGAEHAAPLLSLGGGSGGSSSSTSVVGASFSAASSAAAAAAAAASARQRQPGGLDLSPSRLDQLRGVKVVIDAGDDPHVRFAYLKQLHAAGQREQALQGCVRRRWGLGFVSRLVSVVSLVSRLSLSVSVSVARVCVIACVLCPVAVGVLFFSCHPLPPPPSPRCAVPASLLLVSSHHEKAHHT
jgi:hypothetical protein